MLILNLSRLTTFYKPDNTVSSLLLTRLDKKQNDYLSSLEKSKIWQRQRILARLEALKYSGEIAINTNKLDLPQFSSGRNVSFSYTEDYAYALFPVLKKRAALAVDGEMIFTRKHTLYIKDFFIRLGCKKSNLESPSYVTRLWTIIEVLFKVFSGKTFFYDFLERLFEQPVLPCEFCLPFKKSCIYFRSFLYQSHWLSYAIFSAGRPVLHFHYLP